MCLEVAVWTYLFEVTFDSRISLFIPPKYLQSHLICSLDWSLPGMEVH